MDLQNRTHDLGKVFGKAILPRLLQRIDIKGTVVVEIGADALQKAPRAFHALLHQLFDKLRVEHPVDQIVFILEMIIKALSVHAALLADIAYADLVQGAFGHQFLDGGGQRFFGDG